MAASTPEFVSSLLADLGEYIRSAEFASAARHPDFPNAFTRQRKLPLPALIASLLSMRGTSQQVMLDAFFGSLRGKPGLLREVSDRAFAAARERLHTSALVSLNDDVVQRADAAGLVGRWRGLRVVAGDSSVLMPALRQCHRTRAAASADQRLFALFLPGAELTLHASVYSAAEPERLQLVRSLTLLGPEDVLVLDRGYPATWLLALLNERGIRYCMRCDSSSSWKQLTQFMRSGKDEDIVTLKAPTTKEAAQWRCSRTPPQVRLVRQVAPNGEMRVMVTNLSSQAVPVEAFAELYHKRWRIEELFKRLKHRLKLECVSGLSQHALLIDVAAKILADNIAALMCAAASQTKNLQAQSRRCNRTYAAANLQAALPRILLWIGNILKAIRKAIRALASNTQRVIQGRTKVRRPSHYKPHPSAVYKG